MQNPEENVRRCSSVTLFKSRVARVNPKWRPPGRCKSHAPEFNVPIESPTESTSPSNANATLRQLILNPKRLTSAFPRSHDLFLKRKPSVSTDWMNKLPDFVRRLEESLYRQSASLVLFPF